MSGDTETKPGKGPTHLAYKVSRGRDGQSYFNRIGAAFEHKDGSGFDVVLSATPVDGRITLRTAQDRLTDMREGKNAKREGQREQDQER